MRDKRTTEDRANQLEAEFRKRKILETETKILGVEITNTERQQDKYILTHPKNMYETV